MYACTALHLCRRLLLVLTVDGCSFKRLNLNLKTSPARPKLQARRCSPDKPNTCKLRPVKLRAPLVDSRLQSSKPQNRNLKLQPWGSRGVAGVGGFKDFLSQEGILWTFAHLCYCERRLTLPRQLLGRKGLPLPPHSSTYKLYLRMNAPRGEPPQPPETRKPEKDL